MIHGFILHKDRRCGDGRPAGEEGISGMKRKGILCALFALVIIALAPLACQTAMAGEKARWPETGTTVWYDGKLKIDVSHISDGYFQAAVSTKTTKKLKLQVQKGDTKLNYDLNGNGDYEVIPLQLGSGYYSVSLYENTSGNRYAAAGSLGVTPQLKQENIAFLYPNQYVNYTPTSEAVLQADTLCNARMSEKEAYVAIRDYMKANFVYDYVKAITVTAGMLPDIEGSYSKHMGICQDLSAIMVCMLRTQGVPSRMMIGYADKNYHAWTVTEIEGKQVLFDPTAALSAISKPKTYTTERYY